MTITFSFDVFSGSSIVVTVSFDSLYFITIITAIVIIKIAINGIIIYFIFQKQFIEGITMTGIK